MAVPAGRVPVHSNIRHRLIVSLALATLALSSCGGGSSTEAQRLSAREQTVVSDAQRAIRSHCRQIALFVSRRGSQPSSSQTERTFRAVDNLIALARQKPDPLYQGREDLRDLLNDMAEDLDGTNCSPPLLDRIEEGLRTVP
jgi:hypothetical protein